MTRAIGMLLVLCTAAVGADFVYDKHIHFPFEEWPGFHGLFAGASTCLYALVASGLRRLARPEDEDA